jgi:hypothetical protein
MARSRNNVAALEAREGTRQDINAMRGTGKAQYSVSLACYEQRRLIYG